MNPPPSRPHAPQPPLAEPVPPNEFEHSSPPEEGHDAQGQRELASSDSGLARVTEDLIDILIHRGVIQFTDFPAAAQAKLLQRRLTRATLSRRLRLLDGEADTI